MRPSTKLVGESARPRGDGHFLVSNTLLNLIGLGAPLVVALVAYPLFYREIGEEAFGVLQLVQLIAGFTLFDLGLSRALTQIVARRIAEKDEAGTPALIWTTLWIMLGVGGVAALAMYAASPLLVDALHVSAPMRDVTVSALRVAGLSFLFIGASAALRGVLEAHLRFDISNLLRAPLGAALYLAPLLLLVVSTNLVHLVAATVTVRAASCLAYFLACRRIVPALRQPTATRQGLGSLLRFGGWMTVSNVISPLMTSLDRFMIAGLFSVAVVPYYAVPYDVITRLLLVASAFSGVLFPKLTQAYRSDRAGAGELVRKATSYVSMALFPAVLVAVLLAPEGLRVWMGPDFAAESTSILRILALGVLVNALAHIPFSFVQAAGRPDLTAKLHLLELPLYVLFLLILADRFGLRGVAIAWAIRAAIDAAALYLLTWRLLPEIELGARLRWSLVVMISSLVSVVVVAPGVEIRAGVSVLVVICGALLLARSWRSRSERGPG